MNTTSTYEKEFTFFKKCLDYYKIPYHTYSLNKNFFIEDLGIRHALGFSTQSYQNLLSLFKETLSQNKLCYLTDELSCHYICFLFYEGNVEKVFVIGPYITRDEKEHIESFIHQQHFPAEWLHLLHKYYFQISTTSDADSLDALISALAETIWGENNYKVQYSSNGLLDSFHPMTLPTEVQRHLDLSTNIEMIETLYATENELANAISCGQTARARAIFSNFPWDGFKYEAEALRNLKNFSITINTIFRKSAEQGGVHPLYVDQLSTIYMTRIEALIRTDNVFDLWTDMIQKYCALVNNYNTRNYSLPIQKVISRINFDITADLSLNTMAKHLQINASYLSNLFKKETGYTLTHYVNKKRIEHAAFLLSNTPLPISTIAQQCGILDDNYFTKLFKKHYDMTPSQFREVITRELS